MELLNNFSDLFISVWDKGIHGVDIFQILIGIGIFFIFLIFRGIISKVLIKRLQGIAKRTTNKLDDTFVQAMEGPARFLPIGNWWGREATRRRCWGRGKDQRNQPVLFSDLHVFSFFCA